MNPTPYPALTILCITLLAAATLAAAQAPDSEAPAMSMIDVREFLPEDHAADGSVSYQEALQEALDAAAPEGAIIGFPPMTYLLDNPAGLTIRSNMTLQMRGATFVFAKDLEADGHAFVGRDVSNIRLEGGTVVGQRAHWDPGTNIAGIRLFGPCRNISIEAMRFEDLTSNGIGVFAESYDAMAAEIRIRDVVTKNCCNFYGDYLSDQVGPAKGSEREDQGNIALYYVDEWVVEGCLLEGSQSDGTHFCNCRNGRFSNNRVIDSKMGGYFVESGERVLAHGNIMSRNGSRGCTIERDSLDCTLVDNIVENSGREGLWAPDVAAILVTGNVFRENGRKDDTDRDSEIRIDNMDKWETQTRDLRITDNLFYTSKHQHSVIQITANVNQVVVRSNSFRGPVENAPVVWDKEHCQGIIIEANDTPPSP